MNELALFAGGGEESLQDICWGGEPFVPLKSRTIHAEFYCNGKLMDSYLDSLSGTTSQPSTANLGAERSMSSAVDFPVRTCHQQEKAQDLMENDRDFGKKWQGWLAKYDQDSCSWKTPQCSLITDSDECLETYPTSGLMRDGQLWEQTRWAHNITATGYGLLPTPTARDFNGHTITKKRPKGFNKVLPNVFKLEFQLQGQCYPHPTFSEELMLWIVGWTDLKPLEMDKFQEWQRQHGIY